jgi:hypothetical protein
LKIVFDLNIAFLAFVEERRLPSFSARYRKMLLCLALFGSANPTLAKLTTFYSSRIMTPSPSIDPNAKPFFPTKTEDGTSGDTSGGADAGENQLAAALLQALSVINNQNNSSASATGTPSPPQPETGVILTSGVGFHSSGPVVTRNYFFKRGESPKTNTLVRKILTKYYDITDFYIRN